MLVAGGVEAFEQLQKRTQLLGREIDGMLMGVEMYIKRTLYTHSKKAELEQEKEKVIQMQQFEETIKVVATHKTVLTLFLKIEENLDKSQFQTAVLIYRFLEEKKLAGKLAIPDFTELYQQLKSKAAARLTHGVDNMLATWLSYCSTKQKEIGDKAYAKIDPILKQLYSKQQAVGWFG